MHGCGAMPAGSAFLAAFLSLSLVSLLLVVVVVARVMPEREESLLPVANVGGNGQPCLYRSSARIMLPPIAVEERNSRNDRELIRAGCLSSTARRTSSTKPNLENKKVCVCARVRVCVRARVVSRAVTACMKRICAARRRRVPTASLHNHRECHNARKVSYQVTDENGYAIVHTHL